MVGQRPALARLDGTNTLWYRLSTTAGRSYCAEAATGREELQQTDPVVTVFAADGTTIVVLNDNATSEPRGTGTARACWVASADATVYATVVASGAVANPYTVTLRVVDTTLFCPWFFLAGDYNAFTILRNTTDTPVALTVTWRGLDGTIVGAMAATLAANGTLAVNGRPYVTGATSGAIEVAHDGSPEAIQGSTTTLSGTLGVGFDAVFTQRRPW